MSAGWPALACPSQSSVTQHQREGMEMPSSVCAEKMHNAMITIHGPHPWSPTSFVAVNHSWCVSELRRAGLTQSPLQERVIFRPIVRDIQRKNMFWARKFKAKQRVHTVVDKVFWTNGFMILRWGSTALLELLTQRSFLIQLVSNSAQF